MAKPLFNLPGCSGHTRVSISAVDLPGNLFDQATAAKWSRRPSVETTEGFEVPNTSCVLHWFLSGVLAAMPSMHAIFAPTITATNALWKTTGPPSRLRMAWKPAEPPSASSRHLPLRLPRPALRSASPYLTLAAILAAGYDGIRRQLPLPIPPAEIQKDLPGGRSGERRLARI
ncbi:hypothetical protein BC830DRAFT_1171439 [Chytriomyces sp. MP71]|nr:hypothetical protein BC830DRAFT_1171439 [Chytriomyces sp. MP71]